MLGRKRNKHNESENVRSPHITRRKQSTFQYSSNRSQREGASARSTPQTSETAATAKKVKFIKTQYVVVFAVFLFLGLYLSFITSQPKISVIGEPKMVNSIEEYSQAVNTISSGISSKSKFSVNRQKIEQDLKAKFPEVAEANVTTPFFSRSLRVNLALSEPTIIINSNSGSFVIDDSGVAVKDISKSAGQLESSISDLPRVTDQSGVDIAVGKSALTSSQVNFIGEIKHQSDAKSMQIESINLMAGGGELDVRFAGYTYFVKFNLNEDARTSFGTFIATKEHLEQSNAPPTEYIDVRIPERSYVK